MAIEISALASARKMARHGHRDWLAWEDGNGAWAVDRAGCESMRSVHGAVMAGRKAFHVWANSGTLAKIHPAMAIVMLRNAEAGHIWD